ncbi:zinc finger CCCH domain-containing protein 14-like isoform X2 [Babylonia areolata]|uniref:zinc finger CCCH domain-containing protein 14-like isoform X2 n=1 Tax=Babylonia areolata TaxID=304850 RepID=UPI003FD03F69
MNMDVGSEISGKIRSAIKAKLVELNAYVDEELPDYIMVMVANKKSQPQMSADLGLFLGANTDKFTTWLHGLLQKLQSITSESSAAIFDSASSSNKPEKSTEKTRSGEQTATNEVSSRHKRHNEKQSTDENRSKKRSSDEGTDDKKQKRRKSDQEKKPKASDDAKTKDVSEKEVLASDDVVAKANSLLAASAASDRDNTDSTTVSHQSKETSQRLDKVQVIAVSENRETEQEGRQRVETNQPKQATTIDVSDILVEEDDLTELLFTENDELTEELEQETALVPPMKKSDSGKATIIQVSDEESSAKPKRVVGSSDFSKDISPHRSARPRAVTSPIRQTGRRSALVRAVEPRPSELLTRKRRAPVSVIGSISRDSEEEEGYDPRNPAVGNVASVVKVTARKSSVPPKLQANKSLLLKAMTEAERSVENQRRVAITPIRPFMRSEGRDRDRDHDRRTHSSSSSSRESRRHSPTSRIAQTSLRQAISQPRSSRHSPPVYIPTRKVQPAPRMETGDKVGIVSKSRRQEAHERAWLDREQEAVAPPRKCIKPEKTAPIVNFVIETEYDSGEGVPRQRTPPEDRKVKKEPLSPKKKLQYSAATPDPSARSPGKAVVDSEIDSRVVECEPEVVGSPVARSMSESGSQGVPALLEDMDQEEFLLDQDVLELTESSTGLLEEDYRQALIKEKPKDRTRFVVTLDGVDTDQYNAGAMETAVEEFVAEEMEVDKLQPVKTSLPPPPPVPVLAQSQFAPLLSKEPAPVLISPPKIQPLNISLKDSDEEGDAMEVEMTPLKKAKMMERCKFWPACVNGSACDYHHPTTHCKTFPNCRFGDKCLYIHPNCRFDSKCMRADCPFTHSGVRSIPPPYQAPYVKPAYRAPVPPPAPTAPSHGSPLCKFFPKCTNMACPFFHPKPCRFGLTCKNKEKGCPFYHPALPTMDKLTWVAASAKDPSLLEAAALKDAKKVD